MGCRLAPERACTAEEVRAIIGRMGAVDVATTALGRIALRPHQLQAVARLKEMIARSGVALLADEAGLGKTYVALAIARDFRAPLVVAPAVLHPMWSAACEATGVEAEFVSYERLSRSPPPGRPARVAGTASGSVRRSAGAGFGRRGEGPPDHDLVVLDEAHHARNPATRRYRALADLGARATVLLMSATPIHNRRRDLESLLALGFGERAATMTDAELAQHVIRRDRQAAGLGMRIPEPTAPAWLAISHDEALLEALVALPPPLPPADGGDGGVLLVHSLVRQWASSDGALRGALVRRSARAAALVEALASGRHPTRAELRDWSHGEGAVQLAFPEIMASPAAGDSTGLLEAVQAHIAAVDDLRRLLKARASRDAERAQRIREVRTNHPSEKVVAFTSYADTATGLYRELRADGRVAMLTARGGRVAGGALTRTETLDRFAPAAQGVRAPSVAERIDLLIATDLVSEGVNLQDASVVIHLDLPWTPARLEQRVGRAARLGSAHERVAVYAMTPPASAERLIAVERILRDKLTIAGGFIGAAADVLPPLPGVHPPDESTSSIAFIRRILARWSSCPAGDAMDACAVAAVRAPDDGLVALVRTEAGPELVACHAGRVSSDPAIVARAIGMAEGAECAVDADRLATERAVLANWLAARRGAAAAGAGSSAPSRARVVQRIAGIAQRAPAHRRPLVAMLAARARRAIGGGLSAGAERALAALAGGSGLGDDEWLEALGAFDGGRPARDREGAGDILALLLLQRDAGGDCIARAAQRC